ncbi:MAG: hypothetical protein AABY42_00285 [Nitrospirota bacterium]
MKTSLWIVLALIVGIMGFFGGYKISYVTGVQPGYFEAAEAGGYGGGGAVQGLDKATADYYQNLYKEE